MKAVGWIAAGIILGLTIGGWAVLGLIFIGLLIWRKPQPKTKRRRA